MELEFILNGIIKRLTVSPKKRLLDVLREDFGLTGTKEGCGKGECGACTVFMDGKRVNACLVPALQLPGSRVLTIESVQHWPVFREIEKAFIENGAVQCGFCTPGFVMSTIALLVETNDYLPEQIQSGLSGNLCRCTGYTNIIAAVQELASRPDLVQQIRKEWQHDFNQ